VYLNCETCLRLWTSYGVVVREQRDAHPGRKDALRVKLDGALESIRVHELTAHTQRPPEESKTAVA
jgi:hypothetical protein